MKEVSEECSRETMGKGGKRACDRRVVTDPDDCNMTYTGPDNNIYPNLCIYLVRMDHLNTSFNNDFRIKMPNARMDSIITLVRAVRDIRERDAWRVRDNNY